MTSTDPLWYKDAVFCQLHVKTFCDSGADGVGNFKGLASKLDYLQTLEVDCLRLLPTLSLAVPTTAMTSQTATSIHPTYESLQDFHELLEAAHARGLKVISELEPYSQHLHEPRGTDPSTPASRFVVCLRNHDQGGNRAVGERLNHQIDLAAFRAASVVRLTTPQAPLLFMGQEGPRPARSSTLPTSEDAAFSSCRFLPSAGTAAPSG